MKIAPFSPFLTRLLLFFYMLVSTEGLHNHLVLCFEMNGDVTVEWTPFGLCCNQSNSVFPSSEWDGPILNDMPEHCGACVDEPISTSLSQQLSAPFSKAHFYLSNIALPLSIYPYTITDPSSCLVDASYAPDTAFLIPAALRTVILLI